MLITISASRSKHRNRKIIRNLPNGDSLVIPLVNLEKPEILQISEVFGSITVSISACPAGDRGSIPRQRDFFGS